MTEGIGDDYPLIAKWDTQRQTATTIMTRCTINSEDLPLDALAEIARRAVEDGHPPGVNVEMRKADCVWEVTLKTHLVRGSEKVSDEYRLADLEGLTVEQVAGIGHALEGTLGGVAFHPKGCGTCSRAVRLAQHLGLDVDTQTGLDALGTDMEDVASAVIAWGERLRMAARG